MAKPEVHAASSARRFGGKMEDYLPIHQLMDSSKGAFPDNRHRALTHNAWFIGPDGILERVFGTSITNSDGRSVSVRILGEQHILEDFGNRFIPSVQDYLENMDMQEWMNNGMHGTFPPSQRRIHEKKQREPKFNIEETRID